MADILQKSAARAKVILLDACHSGANFEGKGPKTIPPSANLTLAASNLVGEPGQSVTDEAIVTPEISVFLPLVTRSGQ